MQRDRRHNPYPFTWEIPVAIGCGVLLLAVLGAHAGRTAANLVAGGGLTFPAPEKVLGSLGALLQGDAGAGLSVVPAQVAGQGALWGWMAASEVLVLVLSAWAVAAILRRWGPGRVRGMASRSEARELLGVQRLRRARAVVRPDLYGRQGTGR
ncbi:conjugal transfer protein [Ornithinimicrobium cavernae]|uniref:conjugal transfer protein n=1 Tax=Ornithinimicrobium cavernae TaxID=2666047 RepID=UPI000D686FF1|nr:conjugal transfer protein [Ornithinimicrobium cavernae]